MNRTLNIIYEDKHLLICHKKAGIPVQTSSLTSKDMVSIIKNYLSEHNNKKGEPYLGLIQRLDQPVEGIIIFAKTPLAAKELNKQQENNLIEKYYFAIVKGVINKNTGRLEDYIIKDKFANKAMIVGKNTPNSKSAVLEYNVIDICENTTLLDIHLITGRFHQIRAQLSNWGHPILGDRKYSTENNADTDFPALCAHKIIFNHPVSKKRIEFEVAPEGNSFYISWTKSTYLDGRKL